MKPSSLFIRILYLIMKYSGGEGAFFAIMFDETKDQYSERGGDPCPQNRFLRTLCVPTTSSTSCDQAVLVDQAADASSFTDAVLAEIDRLG